MGNGPLFPKSTHLHHPAISQIRNIPVHPQYREFEYRTAKGWPGTCKRSLTAHTDDCVPVLTSNKLDAAFSTWKNACTSGIPKTRHSTDWPERPTVTGNCFMGRSTRGSSEALGDGDSQLPPIVPQRAWLGCVGVEPVGPLVPHKMVPELGVSTRPCSFLEESFARDVVCLCACSSAHLRCVSNLASFVTASSSSRPTIPAPQA